MVRPGSTRTARPAAAAVVALRDAHLADLPMLLRLEERCFDTDRLSRRSFQHLLTRGHAFCLVAEAADGEIVGYALVLLHGNTSLARLYSLAVDPAARGRGLARQLVQACEARARDEGCAVLRLEVGETNAPAIGLYGALGYRRFARVADYYEDGTAALRMEKLLAGGDRPELARVPYYAQSLDFTCGPASLLMAMKAFDPAQAVNRKRELRLWRESTLIFMTSGHGGCSAHGLALAAWKRGFAVEIYRTEPGPAFVDSVRSVEKKKVIRLVHEDFEAQIKAAGVPVHDRGLAAAELADLVDAGSVPIVLISSWRIYRERTPHWVVVTGSDRHFLYIHDPFVDWEEHKTVTDCMNVPIARSEFDRMARYGSARLRAAVVLRGRRETA